jgi:hypothetical protein
MAAKCEALFKGAGMLRAQKYGDTSFGVFDIGNISSIAQSVETETEEVRDYVTGVGNCYTQEDITSVLLTMGVLNLRSQVNAWGLRGSLTNQAAGAITAEQHSVYKGQFLRTDYLIDSSVTPALEDIDSTTALVAGTDYIQTNNGFKILAAAPNVTDPSSPGVANIDVDYTALGTDVLEAFVNSGEYLTLFFDGKNLIDGLPFAATFHRAKFRYAGMSFIDEAVQNKEIIVDLFADPNIADDGVLSQYMQVLQAEKAVTA